MAKNPNNRPIKFKWCVYCSNTYDDLIILLLPVGKEAGQQLHKNAASNIEQVLEEAPYKAPTIRPPAPHHENYPS